MSSKETRRQAGHRRGTGLLKSIATGLREARQVAGLSQQSLADALGCSQAEISRRESVGLQDLGIVALAEMAAVLGLDLRASLYPQGQPIRDKGHQALINRLLARLSPLWQHTAELPFPGPGDSRWWDLVLKLVASHARQVVGVEAETRIRDHQALVRRMHGRHAQGGTDVVLLLLSDSAANRLLVGDLRIALGPDWAATPRAVLAALRVGRPLPGSGVILL
jgi:transcriptional regulator with XRE-family HTH domain